MEGMSSIQPTQRRLKFHNSVKVKEHECGRYTGLPHIEKPIIANRSSYDPKMSRNIYSRSVVTKGMDLMEHHKGISRPPSSFGNSDRGRNLQDKALNVRVLNWDHIDKWKHSQGGVVDTGSHGSSSASTNSWSSLAGKRYCDSYGRPTNQAATITSTVGFVPREPNRERIICLLSPPKPISSELTQRPAAARSSSGNYSHLHPLREESKKISSLSLKGDDIHISSEPAGAYESKIVLEMLHKSRSKNLMQTELYTEIKKTIPTTRSVEIPNLPRNPTISDKKIENKGEKPCNSSAKLSYQVCPQKNENIILLLDRDACSTLSKDFLLPESQVSTDENFESNWSSPSDVLSEHDCLSNHVSGLPQFSHQPHFSELDGGTFTDIQKFPNKKDVHSVNVVPKVPRSFSNAESSGLHNQGGGLISVHSEFSPVESLLSSDHTYIDQAAQSSRNPSPLRRLSNGFTQMRKSFSSKDKSGIPLSNSKQFPVSASVSSSTVVPFTDKSEALRKARSSPLRRLIDPILKPKVVVTSPYVYDSTGSAIGCTLLDKASDNASRFYKLEKKQKETVQALLQCSTKNGLSMFKFVTKNKGDALVATLANSSAIEKPDLSLNITMYSVNETTKNSSWKYQGTKDKNCGYLYSIVGQMKFWIPGSNETMDDLSSRKRFSSIESTLFGIQSSKTDQETMKVKASGELAALVIEAPNGCLKIIENGYNREKFLKEFTECLSEDSLRVMTGCSKRLSTTVIFPAGAHSMPNKGAPSPLIHRWRSSGSCDCGGWDAGCSLRILQNENNKECSKPAEQSHENPASESFLLFSQTVANGKDPSFRLTSFNKGIYSVDFNPSLMSDIQAFFISVTVLSSQVIFDLSKEIK